MENPAGFREYTGDGALMQVTLTRATDLPSKIGFEVQPILITNYTDPRYGAPIVRLFDDHFIQELSPVWAAYYQKRLSLVRSFFPLLPSKYVPVILE